MFFLFLGIMYGGFNTFSYYHRSDASIVRLGQSLTYKPNGTNPTEIPVQFSAYIGTQSLISVIGLMIIGASMSLLSKFSLGVDILMKYGEYISFGLFKKGGPSQKQM